MYNTTDLDPQIASKHPVFTTPPATYFLLLLLRQPISKLDTHALSLTPWWGEADR